MTTSGVASRRVGFFFFCLFCARKQQTLKLISRVNRLPELKHSPHLLGILIFRFFGGVKVGCGRECHHTCVADAAILSCPCLVSVPMSLWLMVNRVSPSMPLSRVSGTAPDTLLRRPLAGGEHIVRGRRASSQCCSSSCPFPGVVGRCRRAC